MKNIWVTLLLWFLVAGLLSVSQVLHGLQIIQLKQDIEALQEASKLEQEMRSVDYGKKN